MKQFLFLSLILISAARLYAQTLHDNDAVVTDAVINFDQTGIDNNITPEYKEVAGQKEYDYLIGELLEVTVYIALNSNNQQVVTESEVDAVITAVNEAVEATNMQFRVCNYITIDDRLYSTAEQADSCNTLELLIKDYYTANTINLYFVENLIVAQQNVDNLVMMPDNDQTNDYIILTTTNEHIAVHSFGHFFGLYHTHESDLWGNEQVLRTDCYTTGDLICDTPAEQNLSTSNLVAGDCEYSGFPKNKDNELLAELKDSEGNIYVPSVSNYMSHCPDKCAILFSQEQLYRVSLIYEEFYTYLR